MGQDAWFWMAVGAGLALAVDMLWHLVRRPARKPRQVNPPGVSTETYGHPLPPLQVLWDLLPSPPQGYSWELEVTPGTNMQMDTLVMHAQLVDMLEEGDDRVGDELNVDLLYTASKKTWAQEYRDHPDRCGKRAYRQRMENFFAEDIAKVMGQVETKVLLAKTGEFALKGTS